VFFGNSSSKLATVWFGDQERALSTALGTLAMPIGCIAGFIVPALMVTEGDGRRKLCFIQNCIVTIAILLLAKARPPSPPSLSASQG
jgi:hypothetical protein